MNPKYVVLIPRLDKDTRGFIVCELPYAEDIAFDYKEENSAPKVQVSKETTNYLDSMNVTSDKCKIQVPLAPRMMIDTNCLNMINKVKEKLTEGIDSKNDIKGFGMSDSNFDAIKAIWPIRNVEELKKEENITDDFEDVDDFDYS